MGRKGIVLLNDHMLAAEDILLPHERAELYDAIRAYSMEGEYPDMSTKRGEWRSLFRIMQGGQDVVIRKYEQTCERNRQIANGTWRSARKSEQGTERTERTGRTFATKQNEIKQNETNQNNASGDNECLSGHEVKGVPGVVWA